MSTSSSPTFRRYLARLISLVDKSGRRVSYMLVKTTLLNCWAESAASPEKAVNMAYNRIMRT